MARVIKTVYELITKLTGNGLEKANAAAQVGESAFKRFAGAVKFTHSALEVAEKIGRAFEKVMKVTVDRALEYRGANDAAVQSITAFGDKLEESGARVGDFFVPAIAGASEILEKLSKKFNAWATANRELVQSGVIEWAVKLATALASGVAVGVETVVKAWSGWVMLIATTEAAYEKMSAAATKNNADERRAQGFTEEADRLDKLVEKHEHLAQVADGEAAKAMTAMNARLSATQGFYDTVIDEVEAAGVAAAKRVGGTAAFVSEETRKAFEKAAEEARKFEDAVEAALVRAKGAQDALNAATQAYGDKLITDGKAAVEAYAQAQEAQTEKMRGARREDVAHQNAEQQKLHEQNEKRRKDFWDRYGDSIEVAQSATTSLFQGISQGFIDAAIDGKDFGDTMLGVIRSIAEELLRTAIAKGIGAIVGTVLGGVIGGPAGAAAGGAAGSAIGGAAAGSSGLSTGRSALRTGPTIVNHFEGPKSFLPVGLAEQQRIWRRHADTIQHQASRNR